jgi:DNA-binding beta-propeller fold protein YncE
MGRRDCDSAGFGADLRTGSISVDALRPERVRRALRTSILGLFLLVGGLLLLSSTARASGDVSHVFGNSFKGEGECAFTEPGSVAVNDSTGEVFVFDRANNSVNRFSSAGACLTHFKVGKHEKGTFHNEGLAVDNSNGPSAGDVYAVEAAENTIFKFKPEGTKVGEGIKTFKKEGEAEAKGFKEIHGIAVDGSGTLWVYQAKEGSAPFLSVIDSFSNGEAGGFASTVPVEGVCPPRTGFAVAPNAQFFYVTRTRENSKEKCEPIATVIEKLTSTGAPATESGSAQLDNENTTGVAVDRSSGEVYIDNATSVAAFSPAGSFVQRFGAEEGASSLQSGTGVAVNSANSDVYVADALQGTVDVFVPKASEALPEAGQVLADGRAWEQVTPPNKLGASIFPISLFFGLIQASAAGDAIAYHTGAPVVSNPPSNRSPEPVPNLARRGPEGWATQDLATPRNEVPSGYRTGLGGSEYRFFSSDLSAGLLQPDLGLSIQEEERLATGVTETTLYRRDTSGPAGACEPVPSSCYEPLVTLANDTAEPRAPFGGKLEFVSATPDARHVVFLSDVGLTPGGGEASLYAWESGQRLQLINLLPASEGGTEAENASLGIGEPSTNEGNVRHAISNSGSRVFWSKEPEAGSTRLYVRDLVRGETLRIDKAQEIKEPKASGAVFQTASADGTKVFFTDSSKLLPNATEELNTNEGEGDLYECEIVEREHKLACNLTNLTVANNGETAAVQGAVLGASEDGSYIYFMANGVLAPGAARGHCNNITGSGPPPAATCNLYVEHFNGEKWESPRFIAALDGEDAPNWATNQSRSLAHLSSRVSPNGGFLAFMSNRSLTGYNNVDTNPEAKGARDEEVFLYNASTNRVLCASCKPSGAPPSGVFDSPQTGENTGEGQGLLVDQSATWSTEQKEVSADHWLAGSIPGWTALKAQIAIYQSRYLSDKGRLFFNSADQLVPADKNHKEDVYQYEENGEGTCTSPTGCISLISSGAESAEHESVFLDASVSGNDVFFLTAQKLVPQDHDTAFDIYDARVCTGSSPCLTPPPEPPAPCQGEGCKPASTSVPAMPAAPPSSLPGPGNTVNIKVLGLTVNKPPAPETRAQKLAKALKACKKLKAKKKRVACEKQARKKYGTAAKKGKSTHKKGKK